MSSGKLLKFLQKPVIKGLLKSIPFVGDIADNVLDETSTTTTGQLDKNKLVSQMVRLAILVGILYLVFSGKLDMEQAEGFKEFIE